MSDNSDMRLLLLPFHQKIEVQEREIALLKKRLETTQRESAEWYDKYLEERDAAEQGRERVMDLMRDKNMLLSLIDQVRELVTP